MKKNFEICVDMDFVTYIRSVDRIVNEYFDEDGNYTPHIGRGFVMTLFYDTCVKCDDIAKRLVECRDDVDVVNVLSKDSRFMEAYNENLFTTEYGLNFANAYADAMDIIEDKRSSANRITDMLESVLKELINNITTALTEENLDAVKQITKNMTGGESTAHALVRNLIELKK